jgi:hypothetical protein
LDPAAEEAPGQAAAVEKRPPTTPAEDLPSSGDEEFYPLGAAADLPENAIDDRYAPPDEDGDVSYQPANLLVEETDSEPETEPSPQTAPIVLGPKDKGLSFL